MAQPHMIIKRPASAADHFNNAWLYHTMQRNPAKAREEIRALYARHAPRKMDAAQLYLDAGSAVTRSEEHTSELQSLMRISYAVFCLKKKTSKYTNTTYTGDDTSIKTR